METLPAAKTAPHRNVFHPGYSLDFLNRLAAAPSIERITEEVVHAAKLLLSADGATFVRKDGEYCFYADEEAIAPLWKGRRFPAKSCISGWCINNNEPVAINDISTDKRIPIDLYKSTFVKSLAMVPVANHGTYAAIGVYWSECRYIDDDDIAQLQGIASAADLAIRVYESESENIFRTEQQRWHRRYKAVFDQAATGLATVALDGRFLTVNNRLAAITGYDSEELTQLSFQEITHPEDIELDLQQAAQLAAGQIESYVMEKRYIRKDRSHIWVRLTGSLVRDQDYQPDYFIAVVEDISAERSAVVAAARADALADALAAKERAIEELREEQKQREELENELRHAQKMEAVGQLTAGVAHDFNNLLTAIIGNITRALKSPDDLQKQTGSLRNALAASENAAKLTSQLLAFSRKQPLTNEKINANVIVENTLHLLNNMIGESVEICTDLAELLPVFNADRNQLENAIFNLALNARDAMPLRGKLTIKTAQEGGNVCISVSDNGAGMDKMTASKAIEPFFTTKDVGNGSGLGLSQVYGFVTQTGGALEIDTEPGEGTTVRMKFVTGVET